MNKMKRKSKMIITIILMAIVLMYSIVIADYSSNSSTLRALNEEVSISKEELASKQVTLNNIEEISKKTENEIVTIQEDMNKNKQSLNVLKTKESVLKKEINELKYNNNVIKENISK